MKTLADAHAGRDYTTVQLNTAESHGPGWISLLPVAANGWRYVRTEGP